MRNLPVFVAAMLLGLAPLCSAQIVHVPTAVGPVNGAWSSVIAADPVIREKFNLGSVGMISGLESSMLSGAASPTLQAFDEAHITPSQWMMKPIDARYRLLTVLAPRANKIAMAAAYHFIHGGTREEDVAQKIALGASLAQIAQIHFPDHHKTIAALEEKRAALAVRHERLLAQTVVEAQSLAGGAAAQEAAPVDTKTSAKQVTSAKDQVDTAAKGLDSGSPVERREAIERIIAAAFKSPDEAALRRAVNLLREAAESSDRSPEDLLSAIVHIARWTSIPNVKVVALHNLFDNLIPAAKQNGPQLRRYAVTIALSTADTAVKAEAIALIKRQATPNYSDDRSVDTIKLSTDYPLVVPTLPAPTVKREQIKVKRAGAAVIGIGLGAILASLTHDMSEGTMVLALFGIVAGFWGVFLVAVAGIPGRITTWFRD